jgi:hypothetical protein
MGGLGTVRAAQAGLGHEQVGQAVVHEQHGVSASGLDRLRVGRQAQLAHIAAAGADFHVQHVGDHAHRVTRHEQAAVSTASAAWPSSSGRSSGRPRPVAATGVPARRLHRRRRLAIVLHPGLPHQQHHERKGDEQNQALVIHGACATPWAGTGSTPPACQGWQRPRRRRAGQLPRRAPWVQTAVLGIVRTAGIEAAVIAQPGAEQVAVGAWISRIRIRRMCVVTGSSVWPKPRAVRHCSARPRRGGR